MKKRIIAFVMAEMCCFGSMTCMTSCKGGDISSSPKYTKSDYYRRAEDFYKRHEQVNNSLAYKDGQSIPIQFDSKIESETDDYCIISVKGYYDVNGERHECRERKFKVYKSTLDLEEVK